MRPFQHFARHRRGRFADVDAEERYHAAARVLLHDWDGVAEPLDVYDWSRQLTPHDRPRVPPGTPWRWAHRRADDAWTALADAGIIDAELFCSAARRFAPVHDPTVALTNFIHPELPAPPSLWTDADRPDRAALEAARDRALAHIARCARLEDGDVRGWIPVDERDGHPRFDLLRRVHEWRGVLARVAQPHPVTPVECWVFATDAALLAPAEAAWREALDAFAPGTRVATRWQPLSLLDGEMFVRRGTWWLPPEQARERRARAAPWERLDLWIADLSQQAVFSFDHARERIDALPDPGAADLPRLKRAALEALEWGCLPGMVGAGFATLCLPDFY